MDWVSHSQAWFAVPLALDFLFWLVTFALLAWLLRKWTPPRWLVGLTWAWGAWAALALAGNLLLDDRFISLPPVLEEQGYEVCFLFQPC